MLVWIAGSGPGYRRTSRPELVYVQDRSRWLASVRDALVRDPPTIVVPAHGDPVMEHTYPRTVRVLDHGRDV
jgi:glyoxylase-like metal-dependent hydrolase (beta-lactamase superfamily II)